jgi:hypothetical protein
VLCLEVQRQARARIAHWERVRAAEAERVRMARELATGVQHGTALRDTAVGIAGMPAWLVELFASGAVADALQAGIRGDPVPETPPSDLPPELQGRGR